MNEPRCEMGRGVDRCHNQASGTWQAVEGRPVLLCDEHRRELGDYGIDVVKDGWTPFIPDPVQAAIDRRLVAVGAGFFG